MTFTNIMNQFKTKGMELFATTKTEAAEALSSVAVKALDSAADAITLETTKAVEDMQAVATLAAVNMTEAAVNASAEAFDSISDKFSDALVVFMSKLQRFKDENAGRQLSPSKKLGLDVASALHQRLEGIRNSFVEQKNLTVEEFQAQCKRSLDEARPKLETHLDSSFVKLLLAPLVDFLDGLGLSFLSNFFKAKPSDLEVPEKSAEISIKGVCI